VVCPKPAECLALRVRIGFGHIVSHRNKECIESLRMIAANTLGNPSLLALFASFMFALALVLTQFGLRYASPGHGALVSIPAAATLLWSLAPLLLDWRDSSLTSAAVFVAVGLFFPATVTLLIFEANRQMGPNASAALANLTPLFSVVSSMIFLQEAPYLLQAFGIGAIIAGVMMLSMDRQWLGVSWSYPAVAFPIGAAAICGFTQPITKFGLTQWPSPFAATLIAYTVPSVVVASVVVRRSAGWPSGYDRAGLLWFACVGLCNGIGVLAMYGALARGSVLLVSPLVATYPLVTLGLTTVLFRSAKTSTTVLLGMLTTVLGVIALIAP
jgi:drug/metabolite transporter (DMT)-like permease